MRRDDMWGCLLFLFFAFCVFMAALSLVKSGARRERLQWQSEAVARGVAGYDETTGEWQWTVEGEVAGE